MKRKKRDLSWNEFLYRARKLGFSPVGFMGYFQLPPPNAATSVSVLNAGRNASRRAQLGYLIAENKRHIRIQAEREAKQQ